MPDTRGGVVLGGGEADAASSKALTTSSVNASAQINLPDLEGVKTSVQGLNTALAGLQTVLRGFGSASGNALNQTLKEIKKNADLAAGAVGNVAGSVGSGNSSAPSNAPSSAPSSNAFGGSGNWFSSAAGSVAGRLTGGISGASTYLTGFGNPLVGAGMGTLRFLRDRIATNRNLAIQSGSDFGMVARQQGMGVGTNAIANIMGQVGRFPGDIQGTPQDLLGLFANAPMYGASFGFGAGAQGSYGGRNATQGVRARGMLAGIREAQMMNPGAQVGQIMQDIGGFAANTQAQQQSAYLTGGAYSMIAAGGRQKSITEWAEEILKWLKQLRGGSSKGKDFTYGELMAQYFPGSNIDAWFQVNGVPQNMRNYWWTYVLQKASKSPSGTTAGGAMEITPDDTNVAWKRLGAASELTRTEFTLGSQMSGAYLNKETVNRWFNQMLGEAQTSLIPAITGSKAMSWIQFLPDTVEDLMMTGVEGLAKGMFGDADIGDSGGYSGIGGTGLAGLSPNMKSKLGPMMAANPRLKVTSGLRDTAMQKRLKSQGYSRVSGKPSAHTRGDAADLGPASEYGWIMKNANKFGLKSGKSQGEPWHVGVGDIWDVGKDDDSMFDLVKNLTSSLGSDPSSIAIFMGQIMSKLLGKTSEYTEGATTPSYDATLFERLVSASKGMKVGLPSGGNQPPIWGGGILAPGNVQLPDTTGPAQSDAAGVRAATALFNAGFKAGDELKRITSIAYRESGWDPNAANPNGQDKGLMQINVVAHKDRLRSLGYTPADMMDIQKNANVAYDIYSDSGGSFMAWNFSEQSAYWGKPLRRGWANKDNTTKDGQDIGGGYASPFVGTKNASAVVDMANLPGVNKGTVQMGDLDPGYGYDQMAPSTRQSSSNTFNNTFVLNGGGGNSGGGIDVRRTVTLIADQLEDQMNRRLSRTN